MKQQGGKRKVDLWSGILCHEQKESIKGSICEVIYVRPRRHWRAFPLTFDPMVYLCQSDAVMVDFTIFEQAPELQTGQQGAVIQTVGLTKSAVETIDWSQLCDLDQHHKFHLFQSATVSGMSRLEEKLLILHIDLF